MCTRSLQRAPCRRAACLKDLQRFLRNADPETRAAFFKLGQFTVAKTDLVPIIVSNAGDTDLVYNARALPGLQTRFQSRSRFARSSWL